MQERRRQCALLLRFNHFDDAFQSGTVCVKRQVQAPTTGHKAHAPSQATPSRTEAHAEVVRFAEHFVRRRLAGGTGQLLRRRPVRLLGSVHDPRPAPDARGAAQQKKTVAAGLCQSSGKGSTAFACASTQQRTIRDKRREEPNEDLSYDVFSARHTGRWGPPADVAPALLPRGVTHEVVHHRHPRRPRQRHKETGRAQRLHHRTRLHRPRKGSSSVACFDQTGKNIDRSGTSLMLYADNRRGAWLRRNACDTVRCGLNSNSVCRRLWPHLPPEVSGVVCVAGGAPVQRHPLLNAAQHLRRPRVACQTGRLRCRYADGLLPGAVVSRALGRK